MRKTFLAILAWLPISTVSGQRLDADNVDEALGMVAVAFLSNEYSRQYCGKQFPDQKQIIDYYFYSLFLNNRAESLALESYLRRTSEINREALEAATAGVASTVERQLNALTPPQTEAYCANTLAAIESGAQDISKKSPRAAAYLGEYVQREGLAASIEKDHNFISGCVKNGMNNQVDLDFLLALCPCNRSTFSTLSEAEMNEYETVVRQEGAAAGNALRQVIALQPRLQQCVNDAAAASGVVLQ